MLHAVIMAGGSGIRFWPLSRRATPKQFLNVAGERSLIQAACDRCPPLIMPQQTWVVTGEAFVEQARSQLPEVPPGQILTEPAARNTAPCIALAALCLDVLDPEARMLVMPADHLISPAAAFRQDVERALEIIDGDPQRLLLFGVPPDRPATGYGYIERGHSLGRQAYQVASFREKPDRDTAKTYLQQGNYLWNCGIFVWNVRAILDALRRHEPAIATILERLRPHVGKPDWPQALARHFPEMKSISIDYAVLERETNIAVVEASFAWDDVGSWEAMARLHPPDADGNSVQGDFVGVETRRCIVRSAPGHVVTALGLEDCIIVHTPDATFVARRDNEDAIRQLVARLEEQGYGRVL